MINWDRISELTEEVGEDDLAEVLLLFCEEVEDVLQKLPTAAPGDMPGHLHFLKGSALNIGLVDVSRICETQERKIAADPAAVPEIDSIQSAYKSAKIELEKLY